MEKNCCSIYRMSCIVAGLQVGFHGILSIMSVMLIMYLLTGVEIDLNEWWNIKLNPRLLVLPYFCAFQIGLTIQSKHLYKAISGHEAMSKVMYRIQIITVVKIALIVCALMLLWNPDSYAIFFPRFGVCPYFFLDLSIYITLCSLLNDRMNLEDKWIKKDAPLIIPIAKHSVDIAIKIVNAERERQKLEKEKKENEKDENANEAKALGFIV